MDNLIQELTDKEDKKAYARTKEIAAESECSSIYYPFIDQFSSLLKDKKSYIRTRGFILCCSQAKWDNEGRLEKIMPDLMALFHDSKPTVVRQCLIAAKEIVVYRPELKNIIYKELDQMDLLEYQESMRGLIGKDIAELKAFIQEQ